MSTRTPELLVVHHMEQGRFHPQFTPDQIISMYQPHQLADKKPAVVWYEHLGNSSTGQILHQVLEDLAWQGIPVFHIDLYDDADVQDRIAELNAEAVAA